MGDVLSDGRLADAVWASKQDVGGVPEELQRHQCIDGGEEVANPRKTGRRRNTLHHTVVHVKLTDDVAHRPLSGW